MKKLKFLLLALVATISLGAWADVPTDGVYYLKSVTTGKYVSRGSDWNTRAIVDDWGVAVQVVTAEGKTTCKFVDNNLYLFATNDGYVFTDNGDTNIQWTLQETTDGFKFKNVNKETYIVLVEANNFMNLHQGEESAAELFTFEPTSDHPAKMAELYETTKAGVFTAAGVDASKLSTDYAAQSITVSDPVSSVAEQYQGCGTIKTQTLSGLKTGLYKVTVNAFHRITGNDATYNAYQGGYASPVVYLFANNMKYQIHSVMDEPATTPWVSGNDYQKDGKCYPNGMAGAAAAFNAGKYLNEAWVYVTDGSLNFGLQNDSKVTNGNWTCYQNFTVTYYTDEVSAEDAEAILASVPTATNMSKSTKDALDIAISNFNNTKNVANYNALATAIANANASIADYAKINNAINLLTDEGKTAFSQSIDKYTSGEWKDYNDFIENSSFYTFLKQYPKDNTDFTMFIVNPEIIGSDGWTCEKGKNGGNGPLLNGNSFEYWIGTAANGGFDYYQVINDLPNGHYNIGVQMYNSSNGVAGDAPNGNVGLYGFANNTQKFVGIIKDEEVLSSYTLEDVIVTDGTLRLGVKNNGTMGARWFVADNFTLTFVSHMTETDAALLALQTVLEQAKALIDADAKATKSLKEKIATDYETYSAYTSSTDIEDIKAATTDMTAQIAALNASIAAYANLKAAYEPYKDNAEVETLYNDAKGVYEAATKTTEEVIAYIKEFNRGVAVATLESPYAGSAVAEGTFYLYNLASGKFLNGGNDWGTQMSLAQGGQPMKLAKSGDGYTIDSQISNGGNSHFVGNGGYLDAAATPFTFTNVGGNVYTISWADGANMYGYDGSTTVVATQTIESVGSYWQLVSADDIKDAAIANGTKENPFDVTSLIADYNFGRNNSLFNSWNGTENKGKNGSNDNMNAEKYNTTFDVYQTLTDLPNGRYLVKAQAFYRAGGQGTTNSAENAFLYANNNSTAIEDINTEAQSTSGAGFTKQAGEKFVPNSQSDASMVFTAGYYDDNEVEAIVIDGKLKIGFKKEIAVGSDWTLFDNVRLYYMGTESFDATLTKIGDAAYSTMYLDYPVEIPENVEAYYVTVDGKTATMNAIEGVIPANCGVILKAEDAGKVTFTQTSTAATTDVSGNKLIGFVKDTEVNNGKAHYAFSYKDDKVAFYIPASAVSDTDPTSAFTAKANKAYLEIEGTSSSKIDIAWGGEVTGINDVNGEMGTKDGLYNINGMRVNSNYKGIVLKGNKKFLQK